LLLLLLLLLDVLLLLRLLLDLLLVACLSTMLRHWRLQVLMPGQGKHVNPIFLSIC
jgi:hypothetical protein